MDYILAFVIGGIICVLSQILMDTTKLMPGRVMVILVCTGVILGAVGIYEPFMKFAGAGAFVPVSEGQVGEDLPGVLDRNFGQNERIGHVAIRIPIAGEAVSSAIFWYLRSGDF